MQKPRHQSSSSLARDWVAAFQLRGRKHKLPGLGDFAFPEAARSSVPHTSRAPQGRGSQRLAAPAGQVGGLVVIPGTSWRLAESIIQ